MCLDRQREHKHTGQDVRHAKRHGTTATHEVLGRRQDGCSVDFGAASEFTPKRKAGPRKRVLTKCPWGKCEEDHEFDASEGGSIIGVFVEYMKGQLQREESP